VKYPLLIIGGGLSGIAAGIRFSRYCPDVLILEKHSRVGGLNSYYYRDKRILETGLHAVTNYAEVKDKHAPLNRLFRQLKLSRKDFKLHPQLSSEIYFENQNSLIFSNDFDILKSEIQSKFRKQFDGFMALVQDIDSYDPFLSRPFISAKEFVHSRVKDTLLTNMLLCPLMYYGSAVENDLDLGQFVIMFRSIFMEGMFRPAGTMREFLQMLTTQYVNFGGKLQRRNEVVKILKNKDTVYGVELKNGETIECSNILSTIGYEETLKLLGEDIPSSTLKRLGFVENIFLTEKIEENQNSTDKTIIFYNTADKFTYKRPDTFIDFQSGVICFPNNFAGRPSQEYKEIRSTHLANYYHWEDLEGSKHEYSAKKMELADQSKEVIEKIIGSFRDKVVFTDSFTPLTIKRFTAKKEGAIYGSPKKIKDGKIGYTNLFLAGTDQGFLGIVGSMLSGVSITNQHILPKI